MNQSNKLLRVLLSLCVAIVASPALVQQTGLAWGGNLRDGRDVRAAFQSITTAADAATVRIVCDGKDTALGTVVGADGWVLTKYSELREPVVCKFIDGRQFNARVVGYDAGYDLAMLRIAATGLKTIDWSSDASGPAVGQFLATASPGELPLAIGVVSTPERVIPTRMPRARAQLGVGFDPSNMDGKPVIESVLPGSPAEIAGLKIDDLLLELNGKKVESSDKFVENIRKCNPGDHVEILVKRGDDETKITAVLKRPEQGGAVRRSERMNEMGGPLSYRSSSFPKVIQHDTVLRPSDCGGPVVDLSGKAVGINIARAGRTESYAAPADKVQKLLAELESGRMAPQDALPGSKEVKTSTPDPDSKADSGSK